jgi:predicted MFS family arabinose efflux permease
MRWGILAVLFVARTAVAFQFQSIGALSSVLVGALSTDYAGIGTLVGAYMLPGIAMALPGGLLGQRFGDKRVVMAGLALMALGSVATAAATSLLGAAVGRVISGVGAVLLTVLLTKMVADWFTGREIASAMAILITSWPVGIALGLVTFGPLAERVSWPGVILATGVAALVALLVVALGYRPAPTGPAGAPQRSLRPSLLPREWLLVSLAGVVWAAYNVSYIVLVSFAPSLLVARGYSLSAAGLVASLAGWLLIPTSPAGGYLVQRVGRGDAVILGSFVLSGVAMLALPAATAPGLVFALVALTFGPAAGVIMTLPTEPLRPEARAAGIGVYYLWYYVGMALLPRVAGMTRDITGTPAAPIVFAAAMLGLGGLGLAAFRYAQRSSRA